jgi:hypothetical protein
MIIVYILFCKKKSHASLVPEPHWFERERGHEERSPFPVLVPSARRGEAEIEVLVGRDGHPSGIGAG